MLHTPRGDRWYILADGRVIVFRDAGDALAFIGISPRGDTTFSSRLPKIRTIVNVIGGPDGTIWVSTTMGGPEFVHTAFDGKGVPLGRLSLSSKLRIVAGDARHAWIVAAQGQTRALSRYTLRQ